MLPESPVDWIALNLLPGLGPIVLKRALDRFGSPAKIAYHLPPQGFGSLPGFAAQRLGPLLDARKGLRRRAEKEWQRCVKLGIRPVAWPDPDYPAALREIPDPPLLLYVKGGLRDPRPRIAVVGSRGPTAYGRRVAAGLAAGLAARAVEVVSGGARGVDSGAHRGALEEGGRTVAVVGSGLLRPYPPENARLFAEIAERGALVSEFPLEQPPQAGCFPRRNRLISGLSAAVVVVEAASRSGALITAAHALEQGREVLAVPGPVSSPLSAGSNGLIQQGAKLVQNIEDILEELPPLYRGSIAGPGVPGLDGEPPDLEDLTDDERVVMEMLDTVEPIHLDQMAERAPLRIARLQAALFSLEARGAVEQSPGRYYLLRPRKEP